MSVWNLCISLPNSFELARQNLKTAAARQKEIYDTKVHGKPYEVSDLVWLCNPAIPKGQAKKLFCPWVGPFRILKQLGKMVYRIQDTRTRRWRQVVHFNRLKPCHSKEVEESHTQQKQPPTVDQQHLHQHLQHLHLGQTCNWLKLILNRKDCQLLILKIRRQLRNLPHLPLSVVDIHIVVIVTSPSSIMMVVNDNMGHVPVGGR